jgi:hypothetical protein
MKVGALWECLFGCVMLVRVRAGEAMPVSKDML